MRLKGLFRSKYYTLIFLAALFQGGVACGEAAELGAFVDSYYAVVGGTLYGTRLPYTTQPYSEEEPQLNLAFVELSWKADSFRTRFAAQEGSSVDANYSAEEVDWVQNIQEAVLGVKITESLWIDGGIYLSHVGMESWISRDNWNYTRSMIADFSPYYQSGVKLTYTASESVSAQLHLLNGWQNISSDSHPFVGLQLLYDNQRGRTLTYNNLFGDEDGGRRFFNDFVVKERFGESVDLAASADIGYQDYYQSSNTAWWYGFAIIGRYRLAEGVYLNGRFERYSDPEGVIVEPLNGSYFSTFGYSFGVDISLAKGVVWRNEFKSLNSSQDIHPALDRYRDSMTLVVTSLSVTI